MTLDEARSLAFAELQRAYFPTPAAYAQATEAREQLVHALGEACLPDPPMRIVQEALRSAEEYHALLDARSRAPSEPIEMTAAEAMAMLSWTRPDPPWPVPPDPAEEFVSEEPPEGTADLLWDLGYAIGCVVGRIARAIGGGGWAMRVGHGQGRVAARSAEGRWRRAWRRRR